MNVVTTLDYSILAGAAYFSTRAAINRFPIHQDWSELIDDRTLNEQSGFEALAFQSGNQIVLSYSGTDPAASWTSGDWQTNFALLNGNWADRLLQTAETWWPGACRSIASGSRPTSCWTIRWRPGRWSAVPRSGPRRA